MWLLLEIFTDNESVWSSLVLVVWEFFVRIDELPSHLGRIRVVRHFIIMSSDIRLMMMHHARWFSPFGRWALVDILDPFPIRTLSLNDSMLALVSCMHILMRQYIVIISLRRMRIWIMMCRNIMMSSLYIMRWRSSIMRARGSWMNNSSIHRSSSLN